MSYTLYGATAELSANYHLESNEILTSLQKIYNSKSLIPAHHLPELGQQIEEQRSDYEEFWEEIDIALVLIKTEGFEKHYEKGQPIYTARVSFAKNRAHLYKTAGELPDDEVARDFSFHYEGYNFDSQSEADYLERTLNLLKQQPDEIDGIWFTGGLTDPGKTELFAEYLGEDNRWHRYTPDFVIRRKDGKHLIVEIKSDQYNAVVTEDLNRFEKGDAPITTEGRKAVALKRWEALNPEVLHYQVIFAGDSLADNALDETTKFITGT